MEFYKKHKYPDGDFYIEIIEKTDNFIFKINNQEDLWTLHHIVDALNYLDIKPIITIPHLLSSQADRRFNSNESSGLKLVCNFLNKMNANFKIFHPHNSEVVEALMDNVEIIDNSNYIKEVIESITDEGNYKSQKDFQGNFILFSPDAGAYKWISKLADKLKWQGEVYGASKSRKYKDGESKLIQVIDKQDFGGKDILIIDDICVYGGTFKGLSKMLRSHNCGKLYLAVSHITIQNHSQDSVFNYFDKVFTTNSKFEIYSCKDNLDCIIEPPNLEIISIFLKK